MRLILCIVFLCVHLNVFAQDILVSNTGLDKNINLLFAGATTEGYFVVRGSSEFDRASYGNILYLDKSSNKVIKNYEMHDLLAMAELKDHVIQEAGVLNNELILLCMSRSTGKQLLVKPFRNEVVELTWLKPQTDFFRQAKSTAGIHITDDSRYVMVFDYTKSSLKSYFYNSDLEQLNFDVELKLPEIGKRYRAYRIPSSIGPYMLMHYSFTKNRLWGKPMHYKYSKMEVLDIPRKELRSVDLPQGQTDLSSYYESRYYDSSNLEIVEASMLRHKRKMVGFHTMTINVEKGSIDKNITKMYTPAQFEMIRKVRAKGDLVIRKSVRLANGDIVYFLRYGSAHQNGNKWGPVHVISHSSEGELKWVKMIDETVWRDNEFTSSFIVYAHDNNIELLCNKKGIINYSIDETGGIKWKMLSDPTTRIVPSWYTELGREEIVVPCVHNMQKELLKISF